MPKTEYELMSVEYTETDLGWPAICFCSDFIVALTNTSFVKSFISFAEGELIFKLNSLAGNKLAFKVVYDDEDMPENSILEVFLNKLSMGYVRVSAMTEVMYYSQAQLKKLKKEQGE